MARKRIAFVALGMVLVVLGAAPARASDPVGIYALIDKVVIEEGNPQRVQVWGAFAIADGNRGDGYRTAQRGYLYYTLKPGQEDVCKKEWMDLKSVAGTGQGVGFGGRYDSNGRVRNPDEKAAAPDTYPLGFSMGVVKMGSRHNQPQVFTELRRLQQGGR